MAQLIPDTEDTRTRAGILSALACLSLWTAPAALAQELPAISGWQLAQPCPQSHRPCVDLAAPKTGRGCGKIAGTDSTANARGGFIQEFFGKSAIKPGQRYRYAVSYRTVHPMEGSGSLVIDSYTAEGEKSRRQLVSTTLAPAAAWQTVSGEVAVPETANRVRLLLYLRGKGTIWYEDAFFGAPADDSPNLLMNPGMEPPDCTPYELAPEKGNGQVRLIAGFENAMLGLVKEIGPDEFYLRALPEISPPPPFLWFHFRVEGAAGRDITFHVNTAPFSIERTGGNGTRLPLASEDGQSWLGIENKSWSPDGTMLTFKHRFQGSPAWVASFFPFNGTRVARLIEQFQTHPHFKSAKLGQTKQGREMPCFTITDPASPEAGKRVVLFTTLHHDLETTGALAVEGICRFLLSTDPRAAALRRSLIVHIVPMMNPDGIAQGNLYCPVGNLNRQWGLGTTAETAHVERFVRDLQARGQTVDLFMDFHGWCTPERKTIFMTFGQEITGDGSESEAARLVEAIQPRLTGQVSRSVWRKRMETVTGITGDLNRLSCGWMKFEAGARLSYSVEIFGEGQCTQEEYLTWGQAFAEGIAQFYGCGG